MYIALAAAACSWQAKMVYFPQPDLECTPADAGAPYEDVALQAADGVRLHAWFVPAAGQPRGTMLYCHGNAGNISHRVGLVAVFRQMGFNVLIFDYRGYGRSEGKPSEAGTYLDARAAWDHLVSVRGAKPESIVVFGKSLGGGVATNLAAERRPGALILQSTFTSVPDVGADHIWWLPVRLICRIKYPSLKTLPTVKCPVLVVHSRGDEVNYFPHGQKLFAAANEPKEFLEIQGNHNGGWRRSGRTYTDGIRKFLDKHLTPAGPPKP
ncbi:MAG TPA: alpha/beta hydrolase [Planctomycetota bacterium]|nr:alpha/beta hydrolase [Planctomycetota bacterium]